MGLDMYMYTRKRGETTNPVDRIPCSCSEEQSNNTMYWRKANQIRQWFVDHTGYDSEADCVEHIIKKEQLEDLVKDCTTVLFHPEMAEKVLPISDGYFFGNTEYNSGYFAVLRQTVCGIMEMLVSIDWDTEEVVYYEWW